jgi:hypothetical protein
MPKLIDKNRVYEMKKMGFSNREISKRLNCSTRQLSRICKGLVIDKSGLNVKDREVELSLRDLYLQYESGDKVAERFGISRQAILK